MTQPLPLPAPSSALFMHESLLLACMRFQSRFPLIKIQIPSATGLAWLEGVRLLVLQPGCPDEIIDSFIQVAEEVQSCFEPCEEMARLTRMKMEEIYQIRDRKRKTVRRIETIERGR